MTNFLQSRRGLILGGAGLLVAPALVRAEGPVAPARPAPRRAPARAPTPAPAHAAAPAAGGHDMGEVVSPDVAMERLMSGNARYVASHATHPHMDAVYRRTLAAAQHPFASILACADSRVAPEIVFDQGLGDLFVVRVAGNVVDDAILASLEYAVIHLGTPLIMVLGHERCGAVTATANALDGHPSADDIDTKIGALAALIAPAVKAVPVGTADRVDAAVSLNATHTAREIFANSKPLRSRILAGKLKVVAARYDLDDGQVTPARDVV